MEKTQFIEKMVTFLGYQITYKKIAPTNDKIQAIQNWDLPKTTTEVRSMVNFTNFFRNFIPNVSNITGPLTDLTKDNPGKRQPIQHNNQSINQCFQPTQEMFNEITNFSYLPTT